MITKTLKILSIQKNITQEIGDLYICSDILLINSVPEDNPNVEITFNCVEDYIDDPVVLINSDIINCYVEIGGVRLNCASIQLNIEDNDVAILRYVEL